MTVIRSEYRADRQPFTLKDPISALTHFCGFIASIIGLAALLLHGSAMGCSRLSLAGYAVFMCSMILLYGASASYHSFNISEKANLWLKRIDHCSIFLLIAGSYTPVCLSWVKGAEGTRLLIAVWAAAVCGVLFKLCFVTCPKWVSSLIYIAMGWAALSVMPQLLSYPSAFAWLFAGGLFYTVGGIIYALKPNLFPNEKITGFGNHELFHCFVLAGSLCHFILVYQYLTMIG